MGASSSSNAAWRAGRAGRAARAGALFFGAAIGAASALAGRAATRVRAAATARLRTVVSANRGEPPSLAHDLGDADAKLLVDHNHLTASNQRAVDRNIDRLTSQLVQLDHAPRAQR